MRISDWSSDVCSSDLASARRAGASGAARRAHRADSPTRARAGTPGGLIFLDNKEHRHGMALDVQPRGFDSPRAYLAAPFTYVREDPDRKSVESGKSL